MTPEGMFKELLGLGLKWEVVSSRFDQSTSKVILEIRETPALWEHERCAKDGCETSCYDHTQLLVWRHLNVFQHHCEIHCKLPRAKCCKCGTIHRVRPPWEGLSMHFTKEFEAFALILIREMPMAKAAEVLGEHDTRLWRMVEKQVQAARKEVDLSQTCCVAVDELNVRKGHEYVTLFADLPAKRVIYATEGKTHQTWVSFCEDLSKHNGHPHTITQVSMDMSAGYQKGVVENCRNAQIIFDKFHVLAHVNSAVDKVRAVEMRFGAAKYLRSTKWLWRKNPENLSQEEKARLEQIPHSLLTAKAYQMRLILQSIYRMEGMKAAKWKLRAWCRWVKWIARKQPWSLFRPMVKVANMIEKHLKGILGYWDGGWTNAYMEGLNSIFQATKRRARGYRSTSKLITMLYLIAGKLRLPQF